MSEPTLPAETHAQSLRSTSRRGATLVMALALSGCARAASTATLENTYWKLLRAGGVATTVDDGQREPHVVLHPARSALAGHTGCNRIGVGYTLRGAEIAFAPIAPQLAPCHSPAATRHETLMLQALARTARWRVAGERLDLLDAAGQVVASFESVYLR